MVTLTLKQAHVNLKDMRLENLVLGVLFAVVEFLSSNDALAVARAVTRKIAVPENLSALKVVCDKVLEDFSGTEVGSFPSHWRTTHEKHESMVRTMKTYVVEKDPKMGKVLKGSYVSEVMTIVLRTEDWDLAKYPYLEWSWKATQLPVGANENDRSTNDSAASVYVNWEVGFPLQIKFLRFAWSSTLPVDTFVQRRMKHDNILIKESGSKNLNTWKTVRVDIRDLFNQYILLPKNKQNPVAIALTTDGDAVQSPAQAYYANFKLCREESKGDKLSP